MPLFSTDFAPPPALASLTLYANNATTAVELEWSPSALAPEDFGGYYVYRQLGTDDYELIASFTEQSAVEYTDFTAPLNTSVVYRVTQHNLDFESAPVQGATSLSSRYWWVVTPEDLSTTFAIQKIRSVSLTSPKVQEAYRPIGRSTQIVIGDSVFTEDGAISFLVTPENPATVAMMKKVQAKMQGTLLLKSSDGDVHRVRFGDVSRSYTNIPGIQELSVPFLGAG